jgi:molybdate transport system regulatory protein
MAKRPTPPGLRIRVVFASGTMIGPGKADLLEGIRDTGSIAAAGRRMGMSYKRAWTLVETMNAGWRAPLVAAARGGARHGGAALTALGAEVLGAYRALEAKAAAGAAEELATLAAAADMSGEK